MKEMYKPLLLLAAFAIIMLSIIIHPESLLTWQH